MALPNSHQFQPVTSREVTSTVFVRADGQVEAYDVVIQTIGSTQTVAIDGQTIEHRVEQACGCFWPDIKVGGVCAECNKEGKKPIVCIDHFVVCPCGEPCCWKHSVEEKETGRSLCKPCHLKKERKARFAALRDMGVRALRFVFFKK